MRIVFITGVSKGLGHSLAQTLDDESTEIVAFGRSRGDFSGEFHSCDLSKPQLASSILNAALASVPLEEAREIVFIHNAGRLGPICLAEDLDAFDIELTLSANLSGAAVALSQFLKRVKSLAVPKLFAQITSGAALPDRAKPSWSLYCASKAGQEQLLRAVALEQPLQQNPACLININPGVMETGMQEQIRSASPDIFPDVHRFVEMKKSGRIPSPDVIAQEIQKLIADLSRLENGKTYTLAKY